MEKLASKYLSLNQRQWLKGLGLAFLGAVTTALYNSINGGHIPATWEEIKPILQVGATTGAMYLMHSFTEGTTGKPFIKGGETK